MHRDIKPENLFEVVAVTVDEHVLSMESSAYDLMQPVTIPGASIRSTPFNSGHGKAVWSFCRFSAA